MPHRSRTLIAIVAVGLVALVGALEGKRKTIQGHLQNLTQQIEETQGEEAIEGKDEAERIIAEVRELIDIPADVDPTVATIVDVSLLQDQNPFYAKASNGDHLIVTLQRAILYSSAQNKILDVIPVRFPEQPAAVEEGSAGEEN